MVVSAEETWGSIGGGNVEAVAVTRARALLAEFATEPATFTANLSDKAPAEADTIQTVRALYAAQVHASR